MIALMGEIVNDGLSNFKISNKEVQKRSIRLIAFLSKEDLLI